MPKSYIPRNPSPAASPTGSHTSLYTVDNVLTYNSDGTVRTVANKVADVATVAATKAVTAAESGTTFFLNHATEFVTTLPAPAAGLRYRFVCANAPETASFTVVTASSANLFIGSISTSDIDGAADAGSDDDGDTITFADGVAVPGDWVEVISDGTSWYVSGHCKVYNGVTITKAS
jgi:hypothetical protein